MVTGQDTIIPDQDGVRVGQGEELDYPALTPSSGGMDQALKMMMTGVDAVMDTTSQPRRMGEEEDITVAWETTRPGLLSGREGQGALDDCVMPGPSVDQPAELQLLKDEEVALLDSNGQHMRRGTDEENLLSQDTTESDQEGVEC